MCKYAARGRAVQLGDFSGTRRAQARAHSRHRCRARGALSMYESASCSLRRSRVGPASGTRASRQRSALLFRHSCSSVMVDRSARSGATRERPCTGPASGIRRWLPPARAPLRSLRLPRRRGGMPWGWNASRTSSPACAVPWPRPSATRPSTSERRIPRSRTSTPKRPIPARVACVTAAGPIDVPAAGDRPSLAGRPVASSFSGSPVADAQDLERRHEC